MFTCSGQLHCRFTTASGRSAHLGKHLKALHGGLPKDHLYLIVRNDMTHTSAPPLLQIDLSPMIDAMAQNKAFAQDCSFTIKSKGTQIYMQIKFGSSDVCSISGFPRRLSSTERQGRPFDLSRKRVDSSRSQSGSNRPHADNVVSWKPPDQKHGSPKTRMDLRRYSDPTRTLGAFSSQERRGYFEPPFAQPPQFVNYATPNPVYVQPPEPIYAYTEPPPPVESFRQLTKPGRPPISTQTQSQSHNRIRAEVVRVPRVHEHKTKLTTHATPPGIYEQDIPSFSRRRSISARRKRTQSIEGVRERKMRNADEADGNRGIRGR